MRTADKVVIGSKILASKLSGRKRPFFVQYSLLNGCNATCSYCNSPAREDPQLDTQDHLTLLRQFAELGTVRIKFLGGEPLLRKDIGRLIAETKQLGMRSAMVTNGLLIAKKMDVIRALDELIISLDGRQQVHDLHRGKGTWRVVMEAVELCAREKIKFFISAVVTRDGLGEIEWLIRLAQRFGVMVNFQIPQYNPEMYGEGARTLLPLPEEIRSLITRIIAAKEAGAPVLFTSRSYRKTLEWDDFSVERRETPGTPTGCSAGTAFLQMEPNGDIYPCVLHVGTFQPKNALRDGVEAAWRHAQQHSCQSCYNTWLNENRAIFDLDPAVLYNFWTNYLRPRRPLPVLPDAA